MALFGKKKKEEEKAEKKIEEVNPFIDKLPNPPQLEDVVEGQVISIDRGAVFVDLPPFGTGIIYGREFQNARDIIRKINVGDTVAVFHVLQDHAL